MSDDDVHEWCRKFKDCQINIHDNTYPHSAAVVQQLLGQFSHLTCSPYLVASDFHLFPELKN